MATYPSSAPNLFAKAFPATKKDFRSSRGALRKVEDLQFNRTFVSQSTIDKISKK